MVSPDMAELRRLLAEATPGPWEVAGEQRDRVLVRVGHEDEDWICDGWTPTNVALIAAAVNSLGPLLDRLEAAEQDRDLIKEMLDGCVDTCQEFRDRMIRYQQERDHYRDRVLSRNSDGITHSDECWRWHLGCAVRRVEDLQAHADSASCTYCGHVGPKEAESMVAHLEQCPTNPVGVMLRRAEAAEARVQEMERVLGSCSNQLRAAAYGLRANSWNTEAGSCEHWADQARTALAQPRDESGGGGKEGGDGC